MLGRLRNPLGPALTTDSLDQRASLRADRIPLGILFMLGATVMFALSSALSKWQVAEYSFIEVLFFRAIASLVTCAALILPRTGLLVLRTNRLRDHFGRNATQAIAQSLIIVAFGLMPLAGAVAINFSSPLFATCSRRYGSRKRLKSKKHFQRSMLASLISPVATMWHISGTAPDSL